MTSVLVRRSITGGRLVTAAPHHVIAREGDVVWAGLAPGTWIVAESSWCAWLRGEAERQEAVDAALDGDAEVEPWEWRWTTYIRRFVAGARWSATAVFDLEGTFQHWYVDFHRPLVMTGALIDMFDLLLDATVSPAGELAWKDDNELDYALLSGRFTETDRRGVQRARAEVAEVVAARIAPFDGRLPDPGLLRVVPELPPGWDADVEVRWR